MADQADANANPAADGNANADGAADQQQPATQVQPSSAVDGANNANPAVDGQGNADGQPADQPNEEYKEIIPEEILADMTAVWDVFDMDKTERVMIKELRVIMRALDIDLDPDELEIVKKQIDPEGEGFIRFNNLKMVLEEKLKE